MSFKTFTKTVARGFRRTGLKVRKAAPDIMVLGGIAGLITAGIMACKATKKAEEELEKANKELDEIENYYGDDNLTAEEEKAKLQEVIVAKGKAVLNLGKVYGPSIAVGVLSALCVLKSHDILKKRNAAIGAAYAAVDGAFKKYRKRVVDELGEDADNKFRYGTETKTVTEKEVDEDGVETEITKKVLKERAEDKFSDKYSQYAVIFDSSNPNWHKSSFYNKTFILQAQNYANDKLVARGHVFLNEVYEMLGFPHTKAGAVVGWIKGQGDPKIEFGVMDFESNANRLFHEGYEYNIILDFNVDGVIWDLI